MLLFWIIVLMNLLMYFLAKKYYHTPAARDASFVLSFLSLALLIVAIVTKDPLFSSAGVPAEFEWVVGLFITALSSWKLYFSPLKERVMRTEREVSSITTDVAAIKADTTLIKEKILNIKFK